MSLSVASCQTADSTFSVHTSKESELKGLKQNKISHEKILEINRIGQNKNKCANFLNAHNWENVL